MKYLIRKTGERQKAHFRADNDTLCRMWSTGGLIQQRYQIQETAQGRDICHMCAQVAEHRGGLDDDLFN